MGFIGILQIPIGDCLVGARLVCGLVVCACCPSCLGLGGALEGLLQELWVRHGFPVDTECTAVQDHDFPVWLRNPATALVCPVWLGDMVGVGGCTAHVAGPLQGWAACQVVCWGGCEIHW